MSSISQSISHSQLSCQAAVHSDWFQQVMQSFDKNLFSHIGVFINLHQLQLGGHWQNNWKGSWAWCWAQLGGSRETYTLSAINEMPNKSPWHQYMFTTICHNSHSRSIVNAVQCHSWQKQQFTQLTCCDTTQLNSAINWYSDAPDLYPEPFHANLFLILRWRRRWNICW